MSWTGGFLKVSSNSLLSSKSCSMQQIQVIIPKAQLNISSYLEACLMSYMNNLSLQTNMLQYNKHF